MASLPIPSTQFGLTPLVNDTEQTLLWKIAAAAYGLTTQLIVSGTGAQAGHWREVSALTDTIIATMTTQSGTFTTVALKAGASIKAQISAITLTSGSVVLYGNI